MTDERELRCPACDAEADRRGDPFPSEWAVACHAAGKIRSGDRLHLGWAQQQLSSVDRSLQTQDLATHLLPSVSAALKQQNKGHSPMPIVPNEVREAFERRCFRSKARSDKDGQALMLDVWGSEKCVLRVSGGPVLTETDRNVQDGIKFLSAGLMQAIRNPAAHEPANDWPIGQDDCLDILSLLSFLFRKLDDATVVPARKAV